MQTIYIFDRETLKNIAQPVAKSYEAFKKNPKLFFPPWDSEKMAYSDMLITNAVIDKETGILREMNEYEKAKAGVVVLAEGSYLDDTHKTVVTVAKPNSYSDWDSVNNKWVENATTKQELMDTLRKKAFEELITAKQEYLDQDIEIKRTVNEKEVKYQFENNATNRNSLSLKLALTNVLGQSGLEKLKVKDEKGTSVFVNLNAEELKSICTKIQELIYNADIIEELAAKGIMRYKLEQLEKLNVKDFFTEN